MPVVEARDPARGGAGRRCAAAGGIALCAALWAGEAEAHAFAQRYQLPIPLWLCLLAAGAAVAASLPFVHRPPGRGPRAGGAAEAAAPAPHPLRIRSKAVLLEALRGVVVGLFVLLVAAGFFGPQFDVFDNILPVTVWVVWWVGLAYVSALAGDVWGPLNPWATVGRWTGRLVRAVAPGAAAPRRDPTPWLDVLPALPLFLAFGWIELVWHDNAVPPYLASVILAYSALTWTGMAVWGVDAWLKRGEIFALFFGLFGRFAPLDTTTLRLRPYGAGLLEGPAPSPAMTGFVLLVLALVAFDGIAETPAWGAVSGTALDLLHRAGTLAVLGYGPAETLIKTAGLVATPLAFLAVWLGTCHLVARRLRRAGAGWTTPAVARRFVLTLVPIAIAYHLAHYLPFLILYGQEAVRLASDPLGLGWDLFGTAGLEADPEPVGARFVWFTSVAAIVAGHVASLRLGHLAALRALGDAGLARRSQRPIVLLMILYTMLSLWILAQPVVEG